MKKSNHKGSGNFGRIIQDPLLKTVIAGSGARTLSATIMFPVDMIKTRMQFQKSGISRVVYRNGFQAFGNIIRKEGILALYSGLPIRLVYAIPAACVSFTIYERVKYVLSSTAGIHRKGKAGLKLMLITMLAGGGARFLGTLVRTPFDQMKMRMQVQGFTDLTPSNLTYWEKIKYSLDMNRGAFWNSYKITLLRDVPFAALYFSCYELSKNYLKKNRKNYGGKYVSKYDLIHLLSGSFAGAISTACTIPIDVIKTRVQTDPNTYTGILSTAKMIWREEGARAFMRGLGPRIAYLIPAASLTFMFYEKLKHFWNIQSNKKVN